MVKNGPKKAYTKPRYARQSGNALSSPGLVRSRLGFQKEFLTVVLLSSGGTADDSVEL